MSMSKGASAVRSVLKLHAGEAMDGTLKVNAVIDMVREVVPGAHEDTICRAIVDYGPIGEEDYAWERRAQLPQIPSWFYNPKTGESIDHQGSGDQKGALA